MAPHAQCLEHERADGQRLVGSSRVATYQITMADRVGPRCSATYAGQRSVFWQVLYFATKSYGDGGPIRMLSPSILTAYTVSLCMAGGVMTCPVLTSNEAPWRGHATSCRCSSPRYRLPFSCVHVSLTA